MDGDLRGESERLKHCWNSHSDEYLDTYLVSGVEDPRINAQSILTRALIADTLFPDQFDELINAEWRFGITMTWLVQQRQADRNRWDILDSLEAEDTSIVPSYVLETHEMLKNPAYRVPDYLTEALFFPPGDEEGPLHEKAMDTFVSIWNQALEGRASLGISVIEPACGSANDYRIMSRCGLARFLEYAGFDISERNIRNAQNRFPDVPFLIGDVFDISAPDDAYEYLFVHDLFEHLSPQGLERALAEILRVTSKEAWLSFFSLGKSAEHVFEPVDDYYLNTLSMERILESLSTRTNAVEAVNIAELLRKKVGCRDYYNPLAGTLIVQV